MANNNKQNDWLIANLVSPNNSLGDFSQEGLTANNTQLLNKDKYMKNEKIQQHFMNNEGKFDQKQFDQFYDLAVASYNEFATEDYDKSVLNNDYVSRNSIFVTDPSIRRIKNPVSFNKEVNPFEEVKGILGFTQTSESPLSVREIAQKQKIFNPVTGKYETYSPNDKGFLSTFFDKPVALATYGEDTKVFDKNLGREVTYKKGQLKLNDENKPFYEYLNGKEPYGKDVLSAWDVLTVDGSAMNKWDFMDSDSRDKSTFGTIMKNVATVAPLFMGGYTGMAIRSASILNSLVTGIIPSLTKMTGGIIANNAFEKTALFEAMNTLEAKGKTFSTSQSDYARNNVVSSENLFNMVGDILKQLQEQKAVASIPMILGQSRKEGEIVRKMLQRGSTSEIATLKTQLKGMPKIEDKTKYLRELASSDQEFFDILNKWDRWVGEKGKAMSIAYMTGISAVGTMEAARLHGLDHRDSGLLFLGAMAGLHQIMKSDIGTWALGESNLEELGGFLKNSILKNVDELKNASKAVAQATNATFKETAKEVAEQGVTAATNTAVKKNMMASLFERGKSAATSVADKIKNGSGTGKAMLAESLEETSEEAIQDAIQQLYNGFRELGWTSTDKDKSKAFSMDGMIERYGMAAFGGALGGAMFRKINGAHHSSLPESLKDDYVSMILHGYGDELDTKIDEMYEQGLLGSTDLSVEKHDSDFDFGGKVNYKPLASVENGISQNDFVYKLMKSEIQFVKDSIFQEDGLILKNLMQAYTMREGALNEESLKYLTSFRDDVTNIAKQIVQVKADIASSTPMLNANSEPEREEVAKNIAPLEAKLKNLQEELKSLSSGEKYGEYLQEALFVTQPLLYKSYGVKDKDFFADLNFRRDYESLNQEQKDVVDEDYNNYNKSTGREKVKIALATYLNHLDKFKANIEELEEFSKERVAIKEELDLVQEKILDRYDLMQSLELNGQVKGSNMAMSVSANTELDLNQEIAPMHNNILSVLGKSAYLDGTFNESVKGYLKGVSTAPLIVQQTSENKIDPDTGQEIVNVVIEPSSNFSSYDNLYKTYFEEEVFRGLGSYYNEDIDDGPEYHVSNLNEYTTALNDILKRVGFTNIDSISQFKSKNVFDDMMLSREIRDKQDLLKEKIKEIVAERIAADYKNVNLTALFGIDKNELIRLYENAYSKFFLDITNMLDNNALTYNAESNRIDKLRLEDSASQHLMDEMFSFANKFMDILNSDLKTNPIFTLAKELSTVGNSSKVTDLLDILSKEFGNLASKGRAEEYVIENPLNEWEMSYMLRTLNQAQAVIVGSTNYSDDEQIKNSGIVLGFNNAVNNAKNNGALESDELPIMSKDTSMGISNEFLNISSKITYILELNRYNQNGNIREARRNSSRYMTLLIESLADRDGDSYNALVKAGVDMEDIDDALNAAQTYLITKKVIDEERLQGRTGNDVESAIPSDTKTFSDLRKELNLIEQSIYEAVNIKGDPTVLIPKVISNIDKDKIPFGVKPNDFSSDVTDLDMRSKFLYLGKAMSIDPKRFYEDYAGDLNTDDNFLNQSEFAPLFGQELAISYGYWTMLSNKMSVDTLSLLEEALLFNNEESPVDGKFTNALTLKDTMTIFGIPGAGKSTAVVNTLQRLAQQYNLKTAGYAPFATQIHNLEGYDFINQEKTVKSLFNSVFGSTVSELIDYEYKNFNEEKAEDINGEYIYRKRLVNLPSGDVGYDIGINTNHPDVKALIENTDKLMIDGQVPDVIFIDEITQVNNASLDLLNKLIEKHNSDLNNTKIKVIQTGDLEQNENMTTTPKGTFSFSMIDSNFLYTPVLSQSLRSNYNILNNNINKIRSLAKTVRILGEGGDKMLHDLKLLTSTKVDLDFNVVDNKLIGYDIKDKALTVEDMLPIFGYTNLLGEPGTVAIITDKNKLTLKENLMSKGIPENRIEIFEPGEVQGLERDYVIADVSMPLLNDLAMRNSGAFDVVARTLKMVYTMASRSKIGSVLSGEITGGLNIKSTNNNTVPQIVKLGDRELTEYKNFTIESIRDAINALKTLDSNITGVNKVSVVKSNPTQVSNLTDDDVEVLTKIKNKAKGKLKIVKGKPVRTTNNPNSQYKAVDGDTDMTIPKAEFRPLMYSQHIRTGLKLALNKNGTYDIDYERRIENGKVTAEPTDLSYAADVAYIFNSITNNDLIELINEDGLDDSYNQAIEESVTIHNDIKNLSIQYFTINSNPTMRGLNNFLKNKSKGITNDYIIAHMGDISKYKLAVITKSFNPDFDMDQSNAGLVANDGGDKDPKIRFLALVRPDGDSTDGIITLAAFASKNNIHVKKSQSITDTFKAIDAKHDDYITKNKLSYQNDISVFYPDTNDIKDIIQPYTGLDVVYDYQGEGTSLIDLKNQNPHLNFSEPVAISEHMFESLKAEDYLMDIKGSTVVMVSNNPELDTIEKMMNQYISEIKQFNTSRNPIPGTVRMLFLSTDGVKLSDLIDMNKKSIDAFSGSGRSDLGIEQLRTYGNDYAAGRIIARLMNLIYQHEKNSSDPLYGVNLPIGYSKEDFITNAKMYVQFFMNMHSMEDASAYLYAKRGDKDFNLSAVSPINFMSGMDGIWSSNQNPYYKAFEQKYKEVYDHEVKSGAIKSSAIEQLIALDLVKLTNDTDMSTVHIEVANKVLDDKFDKQGLRGMFAITRAMITGGKIITKNKEYLIAKDKAFGESGKAKGNFMNVLDQVVDRMFPDGIWLNLFTESGKFTGMDKPLFYKLSTGDAHLTFKGQVRNPIVFFDPTRFNLPDIDNKEYDVDKNKQAFESVKDTYIDALMDNLNEAVVEKHNAKINDSLLNDIKKKVTNLVENKVLPKMLSDEIEVTPDSIQKELTGINSDLAKVLIDYSESIYKYHKVDASQSKILNLDLKYRDKYMSVLENLDDEQKAIYKSFRIDKIITNDHSVDIHINNDDMSGVITINYKTKTTSYEANKPTVDTNVAAARVKVLFDNTLAEIEAQERHVVDKKTYVKIQKDAIEKYGSNPDKLINDLYEFDQSINVSNITVLPINFIEKYLPKLAETMSTLTAIVVDEYNMKKDFTALQGDEYSLGIELSKNIAYLLENGKKIGTFVHEDGFYRIKDLKDNSLILFKSDEEIEYDLQKQQEQEEEDGNEDGSETEEDIQAKADEKARKIAEREAKKLEKAKAKEEAKAEELAKRAQELEAERIKKNQADISKIPQMNDNRFKAYNRMMETLWKTNIESVQHFTTVMAEPNILDNEDGQMRLSHAYLIAKYNLSKDPNNSELSKELTKKFKDLVTKKCK